MSIGDGDGRRMSWQVRANQCPSHWISFPPSLRCSSRYTFVHVRTLDAHESVLASCEKLSLVALLRLGFDLLKCNFIALLVADLTVRVHLDPAPESFSLTRVCYCYLCFFFFSRLFSFSASQLLVKSPSLSLPLNSILSLSFSTGKCYEPLAQPPWCPCLRCGSRRTMA